MLKLSCFHHFSSSKGANRLLLIPETSFYFLTGFLYITCLFLLLLPKYDWLFIYSVARVKQNVAQRKQCKVQAVPAEMQTRNALYVGDMDKNSSVRMEKTRPEWENAQRLLSSEIDLHRAEIQRSGEEIKVNYGVDWNHGNVWLHYNYSFLFCLLDVCGQSLIMTEEAV